MERTTRGRGQGEETVVRKARRQRVVVGVRVVWKTTTAGFRCADGEEIWVRRGYRRGKGG